MHCGIPSLPPSIFVQNFHASSLFHHLERLCHGASIVSALGQKQNGLTNQLLRFGDCPIESFYSMGQGRKTANPIPNKINFVRLAIFQQQNSLWWHNATHFHHSFLFCFRVGAKPLATKLDSGLPSWHIGWTARCQIKFSNNYQQLQNLMFLSTWLVFFKKSTLVVIRRLSVLAGGLPLCSNQVNFAFPKSR